MSVSSSSTTKILNKVINKLDDSVLVAFGNNLNDMIRIVEEHITTGGNSKLDENLALLLTNFSASTADAFLSFLLTAEVNSQNIISLSASDDGINFNFFSVFCSYDHAVLVGASSAYNSLLPYFYLCTKGILDIDHTTTTIGGITFSALTDELLHVYGNLVLVKNSFDTLMVRKAAFIQ